MENKEKPLSSKNLCLYEGKLLKNNYYPEKDVKQAVDNAEDFVISMKRDDDLQWNMRLNLIIEEFRTKIFGRFK